MSRTYFRRFKSSESSPYRGRIPPIGGDLKRIFLKRPDPFNQPNKSDVSNMAKPNRLIYNVYSIDSQLEREMVKIILLELNGITQFHDSQPDFLNSVHGLKVDMDEIEEPFEIPGKSHHWKSNNLNLISCYFMHFFVILAILVSGSLIKKQMYCIGLPMLIFFSMQKLCNWNWFNENCGFYTLRVMERKKIMADLNLLQN